MSSLKQFGLDAKALEEWLPWGGIVRPGIMRQKDSSLFAIIEYQPYIVSLEKEETLPLPKFPFRRGWVLWMEHQHVANGESHDYLILLWNPFYGKGKTITNTLGDKVKLKDATTYFDKMVDAFLMLFQKACPEARRLEYQEIMDVLSFSLSHGEDHQEMPDVPLYMDALLSENIHYRFGQNDIFYQDKRLCLASLYVPEDMADIYHYLTQLSFRHTRRLDLFSPKEAKTEFLKYTRKWFPKRKVMRAFATDDLLARYNGYYTESLQLFLTHQNDQHFRESFATALTNARLPFAFESYNLKEYFWGSIPGLFLANVRPPVTGFSYLAEFLGGRVKAKPKNQHILEDATSRLVETTVDLSQYIDIGNAAVQNIRKKEDV